MILGICDNPSVLEVMDIISKIIMIIKIIVPIILIVICMVDFMKAINDKDNDGLKKAQKIAINRAIAAVLIFMIPTIVGVLVRVSTNGTEYEACFSEDMSETTRNAYIANAEEAVSRAESSLDYNDYNNAVISVNNIKNAGDRTSFLQRLEVVKGKIDERINENETEDNPEAPDVNTNDPVTVETDYTIYMGDSRTNRMKMYVNMSDKESVVAKDGANITNLPDHISSAKNILNSNSSRSYNIVLSYGINDLYNVNKYCTKYQEFINGIDSKHNVIIVSVIPVSRNYTSINNADVDSFNSKIKSCLTGSNVRYCDVNSKANISTWESYFDDGVHYNKNGASFVYNQINNCF